MFHTSCASVRLTRRYAQDRCAKLDMKQHHVLKSVHPSPLSAHRVSERFKAGAERPSASP
jgi:uracil DNA glycosylase